MPPPLSGLQRAWNVEGGGQNKRWSHDPLHQHVSLLTPSLSPLWIKEPGAPGWLWDIMKCNTSSLSIFLMPGTGCRASARLTAEWAKSYVCAVTSPLFSHTSYTKMHYIIVSFQINPHLYIAPYCSKFSFSVFFLMLLKLKIIIGSQFEGDFN